MKKIVQFLFLLTVWLSNASDELVRYPLEPRLTIITSIFKSDEFIDGFLEDIVQQTIFNECELIMINANSPGNEEPAILAYKERFPNITYIKLEKDPGLYGVWNIGARMARSPYISNANTDDRLAFDCYEKHARELDAHPEIDLVYSDFYYTTNPNETMASHRASRVSTWPDFKPGLMYICLPNNHPMWRTSAHERFGYFTESYKSAGDWEFWCRMVDNGSVFKKIPEVLGLFYNNPTGLSTNPEKAKSVKKEISKITKMYKHMFKKEKVKIFAQVTYED